jgi:uncharacterized Fe-S cluster protein YjdI
MRKKYQSSEIAVSFDPALCIHAKRCVEGLPAVFDPKARPWIRPDQADAGALAEVVRRCPTGALQYDPLEGRAAPEMPDTSVTVAIQKNGPLYVRGAARLEDGKGDAWDAGPRFALCRCGGSGNKPFCDGTHRTMGFEA